MIDRAQEDELPPPPVPYEVDLKGFPYMPLEVARLRKSKAWLICKRRPDLGFYMINLWTASWHERPAGSLEDDDDVLADIAMCPPDRWPHVREDVLRGWTKYSDGRLYHPVVIEKALDAWTGKLRRDYDRECGRIRKEAVRKGLKKPVIPTFEQWNHDRLSDGPDALSSGQRGNVQRTATDVASVSHDCPRESALKREERRGEENRGEESKNKKGRETAHAMRRSGCNDEDIHRLNGHAADFEAIRHAMPRRLGSHRWDEAAREYVARLAEGVRHEEILAGVVRYAAHVRSAGKENTIYVQQAKTFLGPAREFLEPWPPVRTAAETQQDANIEAASSWLAKAEDDDAKH